MLQKVISLEKSNVKEFEYLIKRLEENKNLSFAVGNSKNRYFIYVVYDEAAEVQAVRYLHGVIADIIGIYMKFNYFYKHLHFKNINLYAAMFISAVINFENERELMIIKRALSGMDEYALDAIFNFRINSLTRDWEELCEIANSELIESCRNDAIYELISVMLANRKNESKSLFVVDNNNEIMITNPLKGNVIYSHNLFDDRDFNTIFALIKENPQEILFDRKFADRRFSSAVSQIFKIKLI